MIDYEEKAIGIDITENDRDDAKDAIEEVLGILNKIGLDSGDISKLRFCAEVYRISDQISSLAEAYLDIDDPVDVAGFEAAVAQLMCIRATVDKLIADARKYKEGN